MKKSFTEVCISHAQLASCVFHLVARLSYLNGQHCRRGEAVVGELQGSEGQASIADEEVEHPQLTVECCFVGQAELVLCEGEGIDLLVGEHVMLEI